MKKSLVQIFAEALAIARARQEVKPGLATRIMDRLRAIKAKR